MWQTKKNYTVICLIQKSMAARVIEIKIKSLQTKTETRVNHLKNVILTFVHCFYVQCCFM